MFWFLCQKFGRKLKTTQCKTDRVEDLGEFNKELTEQSIMMLGQVFNNITYNRRLSFLNALMKECKSKKMLNEKSNIFSESHKELFGQNLREVCCTNQAEIRKSSA